MARAGPSDQEEIYYSVKELLLNVDPLIRATGPSIRTVDAIAHNLKKGSHGPSPSYALAKYIRHRIRAELTSDICAEAESLAKKLNYTSLEDNDAFKSEVVGKVSQCEAYAAIRSGLHKGIERATEKLVGNFDAELDPLVVMNHQIKWWPRSRRNSGTSADSDVESETDSTLPFDFGMMNSEQFNEFVDKLSALHSMDVRLKTLNTLYNIPSAEIFNNHQLCKLLPGLREALSSFNTALAHLSLQFHAKLLASSSYLAVKEMYCNLLLFLKSEFQSKKPSDFMPLLDRGIILNKEEHQRYLLVVRLVNKCQMTIVEHWIRFPESYVLAIIHKTIELLMLNPRVKGLVTPMQLFALLDPEMKWFSRWMRTKFSRSKVVKTFSENKEWLQVMTSRCLRFMQRENMLPSPVVSSQQSRAHVVYTRESVDYLHHYSCLRLLGSLMTYSQGRRLFPLIINEQPLSVQQLVVLLSRVLFKRCNCFSQVSHDKYCLSRCIKDIFSQLLRSGSSCRAILMHEDIVSVLVAPIAQCLECFVAQEAITLSEVQLVTSCELLKIYVGGYHQYSPVLDESRIEILQAFVLLLYRGELRTNVGQELFSTNLKLKMMELCCCLYTTHGVAYSFCNTELPNVLWEAWQEEEQSGEHSLTPVVTGEDGAKSSGEADPYPINNLCLLGLYAVTPLGVLKLERLDVLEDCIYTMTQTMFLKDQEGKCSWSPHIRMCLSQASSYLHGIRALEANGFLQYIVDRLWKLSEENSLNFGGKSQILSSETAERSIKKSVDLLVGLLTSYTAARLLLRPPSHENHQPDHPSPPTPIPPKSLSDLLAVTALREPAACCEDLLAPEKTCLVGLWILSGLVSVLDVSLYLQVHFCYQDVLLNGQCESMNEDSDNIIYDELSMVRNYIMVKSLMVGGPNEKKLPPRDFANMTDDITSCSLFASKTVPDQYYLKPDSMTASSDSPLKQFVAEQVQAGNLGEWQFLCYQAFKCTLTDTSHTVQDTLLLQVLEKWLAVCEAYGAITVGPAVFGNGFLELKAEYNIGIELTVNYGCYLGIFKDTSEATENFTNILLLYLNNLVQINGLETNSLGFPWFVATIFLMSQGNKERCLAFLQKVFFVKKMELVWFTHAHNCLPSSFETQTRLTHCIEHIISLELPTVHAAFRLSNSSPSRMCRVWVQQCFWNYLDWQEICQFVALCILLGPEHLVFYLVTVFYHLGNDLLFHAQEEDLNTFLLEESLRGFKMANYIFYIDYLQDKYKTLVRL